MGKGVEQSEEVLPVTNVSVHWAIASLGSSESATAAQAVVRSASRCPWRAFSQRLVTVVQGRCLSDLGPPRDSYGYMYLAALVVRAAAKIQTDRQSQIVHVRPKTATLRRGSESRTRHQPSYM